MSILDHFGYPTKPLVEYHGLLYTDRASFMGWLTHLAERRRLEIILDPTATGPPEVKNKRVQVNMDFKVQESEPEASSQSSSIVVTKQSSRVASKRPRKVSESDIEEDTKSNKGKKKKGKGSSKPKSGTKANTSVYGDISDKGGKHPKQSVTRKKGGSDSDVSQSGPQVGYEGHSDSLTDS